jgi:hypothetical protein
MAILGAYAAWYTYHRHEVIAQIDKCDYQLAHPEESPKMRAPDGTFVPVMTPCLMQPVPPSFFDLVRGRIAFTRISEGTKVNPYSFLDVLLGRYTLGPNLGVPCNQSATTTDCARLLAAPPPIPPYIPPNITSPTDEWTTATDTPVSFADFTLTLPSGWHGSVYENEFAGGWHVLVQKSPNKPGFTIDCPPEGKGLEAATRLSTEDRSFSAGSTTYSVAFEQWAAPGNDPWFFVWLRANAPGNWMTDASGIICLAQGSTVPDVAEAMKALYETWNR